MSTVKLSKRLSGWDAAIEDATRRKQNLETAIAVYRENKLKGEPWPGTQSTDQKSEAATRS